MNSYSELTAVGARLALVERIDLAFSDYAASAEVHFFDGVMDETLGVQKPITLQVLSGLVVSVAFQDAHEFGVVRVQQGDDDLVNVLIRRPDRPLVLHEFDLNPAGIVSQNINDRTAIQDRTLNTALERFMPVSEASASFTTEVMLAPSEVLTPNLSDRLKPFL